MNWEFIRIGAAILGTYLYCCVCTVHKNNKFTKSGIIGIYVMYVITCLIIFLTIFFTGKG